MDTIRTGIDAWDRRYRGLSAGRYYLLSGAPGAGKSTAALHFLGAGLEAGERCALLTQDDPADIVAHASWLGYDFQAPASDDGLLIFRYRLDFVRRYARAAHPDQAFDELMALLRDAMPARLVIDSLLPFIEGGVAAEERIDAFARFVEALPSTTVVTVPGDLSESYYRRVYDRITANAGGVLHFEQVSGGVRRLSARKLRLASGPAEPIDFVLRPGAGIVEDVARAAEVELSDDARRRIIVLSAGTPVPADWVAALGDVYEVTQYQSVLQAFAELAAARYGALLVGLDPLNPEPAFSLTRELRASGNGAPVLFVSPSRGLRGSTRAHGLRAGGDDFLTDNLSPAECVARIDAVRVRGHRRLASGAVAAPPPAMQPTDGRTPIPMAATSFRSTLLEHVARERHAFFALVLLAPDRLPPPVVWLRLRQRLRLDDGDLVAQLADGRFAIYLHDVNRGQVRGLLARLLALEPGIADPDQTVTLCYPVDRGPLLNWLNDRELPLAEAQSA